MRLYVADETFIGSAHDLRERSIDVDPVTIVAAIRDPTDERVICRSPGPVHKYVGHVRPNIELRLRPALAAAARSRGETTRYDERVQEVTAALAASVPPAVDLQAVRQQVAEAGADVAEQRERVARLSGRVAARREAGLNADNAVNQLRDATRELSEAETNQVAAEQTLASERQRAREVRDEREHHLQLADQLRNLKRRANHQLADREAERFKRAVAGLPIDTTPVSPNEFDGPDVIAALAVARLSQLHAPVVVEDGPFRHAAQAHACLDGPTVLL